MNTELISLGLLFLFAVFGVLLSLRLKHPTVIGLLLMGAIIGPHALGLVTDIEMIDLMIEFGVILLLFTIGMEFSLFKLMKVGVKALILALLKLGVVLFAVYYLFTAMDFQPAQAIIIGITIAFSSTIVFVKVLEERELFKRSEIPLLLGVLIFEDILGVLVLAFVAGQGTEQNPIEHLLISLVLLLLVYVLLLHVSKWVIRHVVRYDNNETILFLGLALCAIMSSLAYYLNLSPSIGAFLAGSLISVSPAVRLFKHSVHPFVIIFSSLFFVSIGTMINFKNVFDEVWLVLILMGVILITRWIAIGLGGRLLANFRGHQTLFASLAMIPLGEFSLIIAKESNGIMHGIDFLSIVGALVIVSTILMSLFVKISDKLYTLFGGRIENHFTNVNTVSQYINSILQEVDTENHFTTTLKREFSVIGLLTAGILLILFVKAQTIEYLLTIGRDSYSIHVKLLLYSIIFLLGYFIVRRVLIVYKNLVIIVTHVEKAMNSKRAQRILNNLMICLVLLLAVLYSPLVLASLHSATWLYYALGSIFIVLLLRIGTLMRLINHSLKYYISFPKFEKLSERKAKVNFFTSRMEKY